MSIELSNSDFAKQGFISRLNIIDWVWAAMAMLAAAVAFQLYHTYMDEYEKGILFAAGVGVTALGWFWPSTRTLLSAVGIFSLIAIWLYSGVVSDAAPFVAATTSSTTASADGNFFLKYALSSQAAVSWMSALYVLATGSYMLGLAARSDFANLVGSRMTWFATALGFIGLIVRWRESYLMGTDIGHIPVSNLYEVFILFSLITAMLYLYYEQRYQDRRLGAFVLVVISAAVGFILWYTYAKGANAIQPLVPALQSYWMKIHVPANFIGYGSFALSSMVAVAYLIRDHAEKKFPDRDDFRLPSLDILDDVMYKSIALGFAFFTVATILGALWAAEAWGGYWSWDPKETWALIVWLNYAAWLHLRLSMGWRGTPMAWWSIIGLFVTLFAFLGVNMFLSGLHSYGTL